MTAARAAVFLDRDGTIIRDTHYLSRPESVELLPDAAASIRRLNESRLAVLLVTNQSGIGRGYFTADDFFRVQARVEELLRRNGAQIDGTYMCPHAPDASGNRMCECRKPGTALFLRAMGDHAIDPTLSWFIGDRWRDVQPAIALGGHGILVPTPETPPAEITLARGEASVADSLGEAVSRTIAWVPGMPKHR
ncbi:MAG: D-glycero-alpha-D-manno-heptose-1,7-bisphosphate 7-phosphatase [Gemmatimonadaceae bacterium]